jgi:hypothetical protein
VTLAAGARTGSFGMLVDVVASGGALVLSGAGLSTESGIPDYRGPTGAATGPAVTWAGGTSPGRWRTTGIAPSPS